MKIFSIKNLRVGLATNSSSTHSVIYKNANQTYVDFNIGHNVERFTDNIAATVKGKATYLLVHLLCHIKNKDLIYTWYKDFHNDLLAKYKDKIELYINDIDTGHVNEEVDKKMYSDRYIVDLINCYDIDVDNLSKIEVKLELVKRIVNDDNLIIVGGDDFYYSILENHTKYPIDILPNSFAKKNGNYLLFANLDYKVRFGELTDEKLIPEYPELIDLKITNKCFHNCKFCYQNSNRKGNHADLDSIKTLLCSLERNTEIAIGGGNIFLHPDLLTILKYGKKCGHVLNITIRDNDIYELLKDKSFLEYIDGIGISIDKPISKNLNLINFLALNKEIYKKKVNLHIIPELLGFKKLKAIFSDEYIYYFENRILFLGYKQCGKATKPVKRFNDDELKTLFSMGDFISVDTSFIKTYRDFIFKNFDKKTITEFEGEFSYYIDAVEMFAAKSSYEHTIKYPLSKDNIYTMNMKILFNDIRKDCGFEPYKFKL